MGFHPYAEASPIGPVRAAGVRRRAETSSGVLMFHVKRTLPQHGAGPTRDLNYNTLARS